MKHYKVLICTDNHFSVLYYIYAENAKQAKEIADEFFRKNDIARRFLVRQEDMTITEEVY